LSPDSPKPAWSFHLALPETMRNPEAIHLANGFALEFPNTAGVPRIVCLVTGDGVIAGWGSWLLHPSLFCPTTAVEDQGREQWLRLADTTILLVAARDEDITRFALVCGHESDEALRATAARQLELDLHEAWDAETTLRSRFWRSCTGEHQALAAHAMETLVLHLEPPAPDHPHRWSAATVPGHASSCINQLFPLVLAWMEVDPAVARELVVGALARVGPDGTLLPAPGSAAGATAVEPWPFLARAAARVTALEPDPALAESLTPPLLRYLARTLRRLDPGRQGLACWPSEPEAWIRPAFDHDLATPALSGFLLAEIDALLQLSPPGMTEQQETIQALRHDHARLVEALEQTLWDRDDAIYRSRYRNGDPVGRTTLAGLLPLAWPALPADRRSALAMHLEPGQPFGHEAGAPLWQAWEDDQLPAPIPAFHQVALLDALNHPDTQSHLAAFRQRLLQSLRRLEAGNPTWPVDLLDGRGSTPQGSWANRGYEAPVVTACLAILVTPATQPELPAAAQASPFWQAMERRRTSILLTILLVMFAGVAASSLRQLRLPGEQGEDPSAITQSRGLARQLAREGQFQQAIDLLDSTESEGDSPGELAFMRANIYFHIGNYPRAEAEYRALLDHDSMGAAATINLALTLLRQGRIQEATTLYSQCATQFATSDPAIAKRAAAANSFLKNHASTLAADSGNAPALQ
jgi:hypothetical protein